SAVVSSVCIRANTSLRTYPVRRWRESSQSDEAHDPRTTRNLVSPTPSIRGAHMLAASDCTFGQLMWSFLVFFTWILFFWMLFAVIGDIFRRPAIRGWGTAGWRPS